MPRRPNRPVPRPEDIAGDTSSLRLPAPPVPSVTVTRTEASRYIVLTLQSVIDGLLKRLERFDPKEKWLREKLYSKDGAWARAWGPGFALLCKLRDERFACEYLASQIACVRIPRKGAVTCWGMALLWDYRDAVQMIHEAELAKGKRWRSYGAQAAALRGVASRLYALLSQPERHCTCACNTTPPQGPQIEEWLSETRRTEAAIAEFLLAHYHGLKPHQVKHLLDQGAQELKHWHRFRDSHRNA